MSTLKKTDKIDPKLVSAVDALLKQVTLDKMLDGKPVFTLTDVMKVIDRKLKLEAIRAKFDDAGYGSGFTPKGDEK